MENEKALAKREEFIPAEVLDDAQRASRALMDVVSKKKKPVIINNEIYLEYEDWQTVGQFYGYSVKTGQAIPIEVDGVKGAKAQAELLDKGGNIVGGAEAYCMKDETNWKNKPWFQLASMAQTRAGAKAFRNRLAWVVVLAGFRPTPAEEMEDVNGGKPNPPPPPPEPELFTEEKSTSVYEELHSQMVKFEKDGSRLDFQKFWAKSLPFVSKLSPQMKSTLVDYKVRLLKDLK